MGNRKSAEADLETTNEYNEALARAREMFCEGNIFFRQKMYSKAKYAYSEALAVLRSGCTGEGEGPPQDITSAALTNLGILEFAQGRFHEAKKLHVEALQMRRKALKKGKDKDKGKGKDKGKDKGSGSLSLGREDSSETISSDGAGSGTGTGTGTGSGSSMQGLETLSASLRKDSRCGQHTPEQSLITRIEKHEKVDGLLADSLSNLAACYELLGDFEAAIGLYREALEIRKVLFGVKSLRTAESMQNLGLALDMQGNLEEAYDMMALSLSIHEKILGSNNPESSVLLNNIGVLLCQLGRLDEAVTILERVVSIRKLMYGTEHFYTVSARQNLTYVYNRAKGAKQSEEKKEAAKTLPEKEGYGFSLGGWGGKQKQQQPRVQAKAGSTSTAGAGAATGVGVGAGTGSSKNGGSGGAFVSKSLRGTGSYQDLLRDNDAMIVQQPLPFKAQGEEQGQRTGQGQGKGQGTQRDRERDREKEGPSVSRPERNNKSFPLLSQPESVYRRLQSQEQSRGEKGVSMSTRISSSTDPSSSTPSLSSSMMRPSSAPDVGTVSNKPKARGRT